MKKKNKTISVDDFSSEEIDAMISEEKAKKPNRFTHNHYKIFRVEKDEKTGKESKITMKKFWAKDDSEAYEVLKDYRKIANKEYTYYFGTTGYCVDRDPITKKPRYFDDLEELHEAWENEHDNIIEKIAREYRYLCSKILDIKYWFRDILYFIKTRHDYREHWQLDSHFIDDLEFNLPKIKEHKYGTPIAFYEKAAKILHKDDPNFDVDEYLNKNPQLNEKGLEELAVKIFNDEIDKCILYVKLYKYYSNYGEIDESIIEEVEFDKKWHKTILYVPGTYKEIDYKKLQTLVERNWNALMNWCKENLQYCWT